MIGGRWRVLAWKTIFTPLETCFGALRAKEPLYHLSLGQSIGEPPFHVTMIDLSDGIESGWVARWTKNIERCRQERNLRRCIQLGLLKILIYFIFEDFDVFF